MRTREVFIYVQTNQRKSVFRAEHRNNTKQPHLPKSSVHAGGAVSYIVFVMRMIPMVSKRYHRYSPKKHTFLFDLLYHRSGIITGGHKKEKQRIFFHFSSSFCFKVVTDDTSIRRSSIHMD